MKRFENLLNPAIIIFIAAFLRLIPHLPNFAPIGAMALFGGAYLGKKWAIVLPLAAMILSDVFLGFDSFASRASVYGSFVLIGLIGIWLRKHRTFQNIVLASLASSTLFFVITNYAVWAFGGLYSKDFSGLIECYTLAIPFFRNTIVGDLFYTGVFFGGYELVWLLTRVPKAALVGPRSKS